LKLFMASALYFYYVQEYTFKSIKYVYVHIDEESLESSVFSRYSAYNLYSYGLYHREK